MRSRDSCRTRQAGAGRLDRVRDRERIGLLASRMRAGERDPAYLDERQRPWRHTFREHVEATEDDLRRRAATGVDVAGQSAVPPPRHATRWQSAEAMTVAAYGLRMSDQYRQRLQSAEHHNLTRFRTDEPLADALGPGWRAEVYGRSRESHGMLPSQWRSTSRAVAIWQKRPDGHWHLLTCYPEP